MTALRVGDIFTIPVTETCAGVGQVVANYIGGQYFFVVFDEQIHPAVGSATAVARRGTALLEGLSFDAKLHVGHWQVVGHGDVGPEIRLPAYKETVGDPPAWWLVDVTGRLRRPTTDLEVKSVPFRKSVSPAYFERALRAHLGLEPWHPAFDAVRAGGGTRWDDIAARN